MCRSLHHNDLGCIARCPEGCCLHVYFGNVALRLQLAELGEWRATIAGLYEQSARYQPDPQARCLVLPGVAACQKFVFTLEELLLLYDLLMSASLLLEAEALLASGLN
ncbi:hypothetical protein [Hymenobacter agri]